MKPINCHLWQDEYAFDFETVKTYFDHSHFWRHLSRCRRCGQLYICDSVEFIYWQTGGGDKIYTAIIPVSKEDLTKYDFEKMPTTDLVGKFLPLIIWYPDGDIRWIGKDAEECPNAVNTTGEDDAAAFIL